MKSKKILLVDDEDACLFSVKLMLESLGIKVILARSGQQSLDLLKKHYLEISAVFLDMMLPDYTGLEVLNKIVANDKYSNIPVIIQTGVSESDESLLEVKKIGVHSILRKPYSISDVEKQISRLLGDD